MSRIRYVILFSIVLILALTAASAAAQGPPGSWASGIACVNLSATEKATIMLHFYQELDGASKLDFPDEIPAGGSKNYYSPSTPAGVPSPFTGSVVVSSDQQISCSVNTQTQSTGTTADPLRIGTSAGIGDDASTPVYAPQVIKNLSGPGFRWDSYIAVQNTTSSPVDVTVSYKDSGGNSIPAAEETDTIPGQSNRIFYQADNADLPNGIAAATISADDGTSPLAVVVNFYNDGLGAGTSQLHSYNGMFSGADKLYVPRIVRSFYGYNGGLSIQNIGNDPTTFKITFSFAGNEYVYDSPTIAPGAALPLYAPDMSDLDPVDALPVGLRSGSAVIDVQTGGPIIAIVNEDNRGGAGVPAERVGQGSSYNAVPDGTQTETVFFSQVTRNASIFSGGFQIANTTSTGGTCDISYVADADANETGVTLPANGSFQRYGPNVLNLNDGYNAAVSVDCTQPVVGINNLAVNPTSGAFGDSFTQGNGLNQ